MCDEHIMSLIVQKFGGTSVGSPERIKSVAQRIARSYVRGNQIVVVVSAMGDTTDELTELAYRVTAAPAGREMDMLLTAGERISMSLLSMALSDCRVPAISFTGSQSGIITDGSHRRARILKILGDRVRNALIEGKVVIIAGFQGVSEKKEVTTLGRGGSDTTAVALAAVLNAEVCEIYKDVDGIYSADPRIVPQARLWKMIPHDLMVEMATRGAGVLHSRCIELAKQYQVSLRVRNSLNESEGTVILSSNFIDRHPLNKGQIMQNQPMEDFGITGVTFDSEKLFIEVTLQRPSLMEALWSCAANSHFSVVSPSFANNEVRFFSDRDCEGEWKKSLEELIRDGFVEKYRIDSSMVPLSVIGDRFAQDGLALQEVLRVLSERHIQVIVGSASSLAITVGILKCDAKEGVQALHAEFLERH